MKTTTRDAAVEGTEPYRLEKPPLDRRNLAEKYIPLAKKLAKPFKDARPRDADLIDSVAMEVLVEAANSFDPEAHPGPFASWLRPKIGWGCLDYLKKERARLRGHVERVLNPEDPCLARPTPIDAATAEQAEEALASMGDKAREAYRLIYLEGHTQAEAARALGITHQSFQYRLRSGRELVTGRKNMASPRAMKGAGAGSDDEDALYRLFRDEVRRMLPSLSERSARLLTLTILDGTSQKKAAAEEGVSTSLVSVTVNAALDEFRRRYPGLPHFRFRATSDETESATSDRSSS